VPELDEKLSEVQIGAKVVSYLFHPLFMPLLAMVLAFNSPSSLNHFTHPEVKWGTYKLMFLLTIAMPLLSMLILKQSRMITSLEMRTREERIVPFLVQLFYFLLTYFLIKHFTTVFIFPAVLYSAFSGGILALAIVLLVTFKWKISVHMAGLGGLAGVVLGIAEVEAFNAFVMIAAVLLAAGLTGTSRLILGAHDSKQLYAGFLVGFACEYTFIKIGLFF
jgi:hypothetical protein